jgi:hypothetical protein
VLADRVEAQLDHERVGLGRLARQQPPDARRPRENRQHRAEPQHIFPLDLGADDDVRGRQLQLGELVRAAELSKVTMRGVRAPSITGFGK